MYCFCLQYDGKIGVTRQHRNKWDNSVKYTVNQ